MNYSAKRSPNRTTAVIRPLRALATVAIALVLGIPGAGATPTTETEEPDSWVIPPGREDVVGKIIGLGVELPGSCKLDKGDIQYSVIEATYLCNGDRFTLVLAHPDQTESPRTTTERFAISSKGAAAPEDLLNAIEAHVRQSEALFEWAKTAPSEGEPTTMLPSGPMLYLAIAGALLAVVALGFILRKA